MDRIYIIQKLVKLIQAQKYLEIGVAGGNCFLKIKVPKKIGVDPEFSIPKTKDYEKILKNKLNKTNEYYEMTSDDFFKIKPDILTNSNLDIVFIDGLHTYEQSLKDVNNSLKYLNKRGFIILHDCNPTSEELARPAKRKDWEGCWCGDVWKTIADLRSNRNDLNIFVLNCDFGVAVIQRKSSDYILDYTPEDLKKISYKELEKNREKILNLKEPKYFKKFIKDFKG